jgi:hypothetical protein
LDIYRAVVLTMVITSLEGLSDAVKADLVASLSCLLISDADMSAEKLAEVASASGNSISPEMAALYVGVISKAPKGIETFCPPPGGGGGGGGYVEELWKKICCRNEKTNGGKP